jgi:uncharacterized protein (DUF305 family)
MGRNARRLHDVECGTDLAAGSYGAGPRHCRNVKRFIVNTQWETSMRMPSIVVAAALTMVLALSSAQSDQMNRMQMNMKPAVSPADKAFAASMQTMMKGMNVKPTGKPDKDFVLMMIPHHQGAIDMAKVELQFGSDPGLRQLATDIVAAQEKEIAQMKDWLDANGK